MLCADVQLVGGLHLLMMVHWLHQLIHRRLKCGLVECGERCAQIVLLDYCRLHSLVVGGATGGHASELGVEDAARDLVELLC